MKITMMYFNTKGLQEPKWIEMVNAVGLYDIIILAETWYLSHDRRQSHPCFVASSIKPLEKNTHGHFNDGIYLIASNRVRNLIQVIDTSPWSITFSIMNTVVNAVYFPPRLKDDINACLDLLPPCDIMLGDINVQFHKPTRGELLSDSSRFNKIKNFTVSHSLNHVRPSDMVSNQPAAFARLDHVFAHPSISISWDSVKSSNINSDHPMISCDVKCTPKLARSTNPNGTKRFNIRKIRSESTQQLFQQYYDKHYQNIFDTLEFSSNTKDTVNQMDRLLVDALHDTAEQVLGSYLVEDARRKSHFAKCLAKKRSLEDTNMLFKKLQRATGANKPLQSSCATRRPLEDAVGTINKDLTPKT